MRLRAMSAFGFAPHASALGASAGERSSGPVGSAPVAKAHNLFDLPRTPMTDRVDHRAFAGDGWTATDPGYGKIAERCAVEFGVVVTLKGCRSEPPRWPDKVRYYLTRRPRPSVVDNAPSRQPKIVGQLTLDFDAAA